MTKQNLILEHTTNQNIIDYCRQHNSNAWKGRLTTDQYIARENKTTVGELCNLRPQEYRGLYCFVLKDLDLPEGDEFSQIVSSCETLNKPAYSVKNGELEEVIAPCIGGVYCLTQHRKKGYSEKMITLLNEYWEQRLPKNAFIFLYSEVGEYYSRVGYKSFEVPVHRVNFQPSFSFLQTVPATSVNLNYNSYDELITNFDAQLQSSLIKQSQLPTKKNKMIFAAKPTLSQFTWFHIREIHTAKHLRPDIVDPENGKFGVLLDKENYVIWHHEWSGNEMVFIKINVTSFDNLVSLFQLAAKECQDTKLSELYFWDTTIPLEYRPQFREYLKSLADAEVKFDLENGSISAIKPFDAELTKESVGYVWEQNEKWCWF